MSKTVVMKVCDDATSTRVVVGIELLTEMYSFKHIGALFGSDAVCVQEIKAQLAIAREYMGKLGHLWISQTISNRLKARLTQTLVWPIVTYKVKSWTLNLELSKNIEAFEMQCYRKVLRIPYVAHVSC